MDIIDFLESHEILWFPIYIEIINNKKSPRRVDPFEDGEPWVDTWRPSKSEMDSMKVLLNECNALAIDTSVIHQLDVDDQKYQRLSSSGPYYESFCKKLPHIFYKTDVRPALPIQMDKYFLGVENLAGRWAFARKDSQVLNHELNIAVR
jgi:hypothetical protein